MDPLLAFLGKLVEIESPSDDKPSVDRCAEFLADSLAPLAAVRLHKEIGRAHV